MKVEFTRILLFLHFNTWN